MHPGLLETLVAHPDIGLVVTYMDGGVPWAIGKKGARNLLDGLLTGDEDPLQPYGDADLRSAQVGRVAEFPHAGDLIIISAPYDDGQVSAFEEHIGSHGGLGGQQTDAFLFHPQEMEVPDITNMAQLFPLLDARRGMTVNAVREHAAKTSLEPWSWPVMWQGMRDLQGVLSRAARSLRLDRSLFAEVAVDPYATGQALLIGLLLLFGTVLIPLISLAWQGRSLFMLISSVIVLMLGLGFCLFFATLAGQLKGDVNAFTSSFNTLAFAGVGGFVTWFAPLEHVGPLLLMTGTVIVVVASWLAIQEALSISRWPAVLIPLISFALALIVLITAEFVLEGNAGIVEMLLY